MFEANARIPQLPPLNLGNLGLYIPVYEPQDDITYYILASDLFRSSDSSYPWQSDITYNENDIVSFDDKFWRSLIASNLNNPPAEDSNWTEVSKSSSVGLSEWAAGVYDQANVLVIKNRIIYRLASVTRPYLSSDFDAELAAEDWESISFYLASGIVYLDATQNIGNVYNTLAAAKTAAGDGGLIIVNPGANLAGNLAIPGSTIKYYMMPGVSHTFTTVTDSFIDDANTGDTRVYIYGYGEFFHNYALLSLPCITFQDQTNYLYIEAISFRFANGFLLNCAHELNVKQWSTTTLSSSWITGSLDALQEGIIGGNLIIDNASFNSAIFQITGHATSKRIFKNLIVNERQGGANVIGFNWAGGGPKIEINNLEIYLNDAGAKSIFADGTGLLDMFVRGGNFCDRDIEIDTGTDPLLEITYSGPGELKINNTYVYPDFGFAANTPYGIIWSGNTTASPSEDVLYNKFESLSDDFVSTSGDSHIVAGNLYFDVNYGIIWDDTIDILNWIKTTIGGGLEIKTDNDDITIDSNRAIHFISAQSGIDMSADQDIDVSPGSSAFNINNADAFFNSTFGVVWESGSYIKDDNGYMTIVTNSGSAIEMYSDNSIGFFSANGSSIDFTSAAGMSFTTAGNIYLTPSGGFATIAYTAFGLNYSTASTLPYINGSKNVVSSSIGADGNNLFFATGYGVDVVVTGGSDVLNIGGTNADIINIGHAGATVNILGSAVYEIATNSYVTDKLITLNNGGGAATAGFSGMEFEEDGLITGYLKQNSSRTGFLIRPSNAGSINLTVTGIVGTTVALNAGTTNGTIAVLTDITGAAVSPLTTKGDVWTYSTVNDRLAVGTNDFVLTADSTAGTGLKWAANISSQWVTTGSDIYFSAGKVGIGVNTPAVQLHSAETSVSTFRGVSFDQYINSTSSSRQYMRKARGTFASPTTIVTGDNVSNFTSAAYDGTSFVDAAAILVTSTGTIGTGRTPTTMRFQTMTDAGPGVLTTALTLDEAQNATFAGNVSGLAYLSTGTGGAGYSSYVAQSSNPSAPAGGYKQFADATGRFSWIRQSDGFVRTFDAVLTANRVYTLQDATGTIALTSTSFQQGGNSFGVDGVIGTNDNFNLLLRTNNATRWSLREDGRLQKVGTSVGLTHDIACDTIGAIAFSGTQIAFNSGVLELKGNNNVRVNTNLLFKTAANSTGFDAATSSSNNAGVDWTISTQQGRGNSTPTSFIFQTPTVGASGTTAQTLATRLTINSTHVNASMALTSDIGFKLLDTTYKLALDISATNTLRIGSEFTSISLAPSAGNILMDGSLITLKSTSGSGRLMVSGVQLYAFDGTTVQTLSLANGKNITYGWNTNSAISSSQGILHNGTHSGNAGSASDLASFSAKFTATGTSTNTWIGFDFDPTTTSTTGTYIGYRSRLSSGTNKWNIYADGTAFNALAGRTYIGGTTSPTALIHLAAGTATASTGPLKFTSSGTGLTGLLATPEAGAIEYTTYGLWFTNSAGARHKVWEGLVGATAPSTSMIGVIVDYFGTSPTRVLTTPVTWISMVGDDGTTYKVPGY